MLHCFFYQGGRMARKDIIVLRQKELKRLHIIHKVLEGAMTQGEAAELASLSVRQIRRIVQRLREEGDSGIIHRLRGKSSKRKLPVKLKDRIIHLYKTTYAEFGPTLFAEKLEEREDISLSRETVRALLIKEDLWKKHRKGREHRQWRERKDHYGEMIQMDGSHHDWLEGRGPRCVFMGYIDDATNKVFGRFYAYEGTIPAMDSLKRYIKKYGLPLRIYLDKHTTYKSPSSPTLEDELNGTEPLSEFGRALRELGVDLIHAHSPQAKGRIERLFNTLQDRMVKEMRLMGISTIEEANRFLISYLPRYNRRFAVKAKKKENLHRRPKGLDLDSILCVKVIRTVKNDYTIQYNKKLYQIEGWTRAKRIMVQDRIDGIIKLSYNNEYLRFHEISQRPIPEEKTSPPPIRRKGHTPSADHPWRQSWNRNKTAKNRGNMEKASPLPHSHDTTTDTT
jgi:hypothetical protein